MAAGYAGAMQLHPGVQGATASSLALMGVQAKSPLQLTMDYYESFRHDPGSVGCSPDEDGAEDLKRRLQKPWDPEARIDALKSYALSNCGTQASVAEKQRQASEDPQAAVALIHEVMKEGEDAQGIQPAEMATVDHLKSGMRDFIDFALDEVDRFNRTTKTGAVAAGPKDNGFNWRTQGTRLEVPSLRRSRAERSVKPDVLQALIEAAKPKSSVPTVEPLVGGRFSVV